ncbi:CASP-like protein 4A1 [Schistocerca americana]|uniref:CASP-like protein 4A1 n=1 Tax=Schistocerca americana TaxID=7009 RepID=UPI001F4FCAC6|nr:CASP-like protein 4A1 [Schistocerca americana]
MRRGRTVSGWCCSSSGRGSDGSGAGRAELALTHRVAWRCPGALGRRGCARRDGAAATGPGGRHALQAVPRRTAQHSTPAPPPPPPPRHEPGPPHRLPRPRLSPPLAAQPPTAMRTATVALSVARQPPLQRAVPPCVSTRAAELKRRLWRYVRFDSIE